MTEPVTIKKVEKKEILLYDIKTPQFSLINTTVGLLILSAGVFAMNGGFVMTMGAVSENHVWVISPQADLAILSIVEIIFFGLFLIAVGMFDRYVPAYKVCISPRDPEVSDIIILKTTHEQDQIAICKAAQSLEQKVNEIINKEKELELLAMGCK
jgi:hypothetical protein